MPAYDYRCTNEDCPQHDVVVELVIKASQRSIHPLCGACEMEMAKVYSIAGVTFKGHGYYHTDQKRDNDPGVTVKDDRSGDAA